tara:strand:+ start:148 stop:2934 length:2787 start_codon:yes stop_codon:yes gene_type:complete
MAGVTQTIPQYSAGISEQPDNLKFPGQVVESINAIPDVTKGLFKRPGAARIGTDALANVQSGGAYFHYYRDDDEGSYIGQIASDGQLRVWKADGDNPGAAQTIVYGTGGQSTLQAYLATNDPENLQFLTINDTTFVSSRDVDNANTLVGTTGTTDATPDAHFAFLELTRTENGRQYGINLYNNSTTTTLNRATRIKIQSHTLDESDGTGHCPGIGTEVFSVDSGSKTNLIFRLTTLGQQGVSPNYSANSNGPGGNNYRCSYQPDIVLLHGGEGWVTGDTTTVTMEGFNYTIRVEDHESTAVKANLKLIRPEPTPFDADTAVTADTVLGGILAELPTGITGTIIGTGMYLSSSSAFNIEVVEDDLMRVMQSSVNDVTRLPNQCKHGYIVKVSNSRMSEEDDYYVRFDGENDRDGSGSWSECAKPGIPKTLTNMPLVIQRTALANKGTSSEIATFTIRQFTYSDRLIGDERTNPLPSFVGQRINKVLFFRNRLAFLSGSNVITSRPGSIAEPDFFAESALTVSASDPIDISSASTFPSELFDGIAINAGLVVFSTNQQFLLASDDTVLNPDTAKLRSISTFNYNKDIAPISLGTTIGYVDNSGKFSRFNEMANISREGQPSVVEVSKIVPTMLTKDIDLLTNSRENSIILFAKSSATDSLVYGYKYLNIGDKRQQAAWFKWKLNRPILYHFIIDDEYYYLDADYYLQKIRLVQTTEDPSIVQDNVDFLLHVDNHTTVSGGSFNATTNTTTFSSVGWLNTVTTPNHDLVVIDTNTNSVRVGRYAKPTVSGTNFTLPGNWSSATLTIGYIYPYEVQFPTFYPLKMAGEKTEADVNSSLVVHRIKLHFGKIGLYETTLQRVGKTDYTEVYESTQLDEYKVSDAPYLEEFIKTVPVYEKNTNVDVILRSSHPAPATLHALSWEGDYSPRFYQRV